MNDDSYYNVVSLLNNIHWYWYWYWYWYLKVRYWYLYWYLDHWYWCWYWYLFVEYLTQDWLLDPGPINFKVVLLDQSSGDSITIGHRHAILYEICLLYTSPSPRD